MSEGKSYTSLTSLKLTLCALLSFWFSAHLFSFSFAKASLLISPLFSVLLTSTIIHMGE